MDIFDILGISTREDSLTDLIANTCRQQEHKAFLNNMLEYLSSSSNNKNKITADDVEVYTRKTYMIKSVEKNGSRTKAAPDLMFVSKKDAKIYMLENKLFSPEGKLQTKCYGSEELMHQLISVFFEGKYEFDITYFYVTLNDDKASNTAFVSVGWADMIKSVMKNVDLIFPYNILMNDIVKKAEDFTAYSLKPVEPSMTIKESNVEGWIDRKAIIIKFFEKIRNEVNEFSYVTYNSGASPQVLVLFQIHESENIRLEGFDEKGLSDNDIKAYGNTINIHMEFSWNIFSKNASLLLHYETNPYMSQKTLENRYPRIKREYETIRSEFKSELHHEIDTFQNTLWQKSNQVLAMAKVSFNEFNTMRYEDFTERFMKSYQEMLVIINKVLATKF